MSKSKMRLCKIDENGMIKIKDKKVQKVSIKILDNIKQTTINPCVYRVDNVIIIDKKYAGMDACCFYKY